MVREEQQCCTFLIFDLDERDDAVALVIEAPDQPADATDAIFASFLAYSQEKPASAACGCAATSSSTGGTIGCR